MLIDHKKYELFGKSLIQKVVLNAPFKYPFPEADNACFVYVNKGEILYHIADDKLEIPTQHSLFLNCLTSVKQISNPKPESNIELVIINFHPEVLKRVYNSELTFLLQPARITISNKSSEIVNNNFLIQKYIEGLLYYFENPSVVNENILVLKLKEIILLLSQTKNAEAIQLILSQIFSLTVYTFKQIIEANLFSQLTIEELAQQTNLSVSSFKREFTKLYNDTPANYIKTKRLEKAAELLIFSNELISDIAFNCGFNNVPNFTRSFNEKYNVSPTKYRLNQNDKYLN